MRRSLRRVCALSQRPLAHHMPGGRWKGQTDWGQPPRWKLSRAKAAGAHLDEHDVRGRAGGERGGGRAARLEGAHCAPRATSLSSKPDAGPRAASRTVGSCGRAGSGPNTMTSFRRQSCCWIPSQTGCQFLGARPAAGRPHEGANSQPRRIATPPARSRPPARKRRTPHPSRATALAPRRRWTRGGDKQRAGQGAWPSQGRRVVPARTAAPAPGLIRRGSRRAPS